MSKVEWLCARCAKKEDKETEPDPTVLRLCTSCKVENWVRPFAHSGEAVEPSEEEKEEAKAFHAHKMKVLKENTKIRKETAAEQYQEAEKRVLEAEEPDLEVVAVLEQVLEDATDVIDEKEAEIAALKAKLAELEE